MATNMPWRFGPTGTNLPRTKGRDKKIGSMPYRGPRQTPTYTPGTNSIYDPAYDPRKAYYTPKVGSMPFRGQMRPRPTGNLSQIGVPIPGMPFPESGFAPPAAAVPPAGAVTMPWQDTIAGALVNGATLPAGSLNYASPAAAAPVADPVADERSARASAYNIVEGMYGPNFLHKPGTRAADVSRLGRKTGRSYGSTAKELYRQRHGGPGPAQGANRFWWVDPDTPRPERERTVPLGDAVALNDLLNVRATPGGPRGGSPGEVMPGVTEHNGDYYREVPGGYRRIHGAVPNQGGATMRELLEAATGRDYSHLDPAAQMHGGHAYGRSQVDSLNDYFADRPEQKARFDAARAARADQRGAAREAITAREAAKGDQRRARMAARAAGPGSGMDRLSAFIANTRPELWAEMQQQGRYMQQAWQQHLDEMKQKEADRKQAGKSQKKSQKGAERLRAVEDGVAAAAEVRSRGGSEEEQQEAYDSAFNRVIRSLQGGRRVEGEQQPPQSRPATAAEVRTLDEENPNLRASVVDLLTPRPPTPNDATSPISLAVRPRQAARQIARSIINGDLTARNLRTLGRHIRDAGIEEDLYPFTPQEYMDAGLPYEALISAVLRGDDPEKVLGMVGLESISDGEKMTAGLYHDIGPIWKGNRPESDRVYDKPGPPGYSIIPGVEVEERPPIRVPMIGGV